MDLRAAPIKRANAIIVTLVVVLICSHMCDKVSQSLSEQEKLVQQLCDAQVNLCLSRVCVECLTLSLK